jgi:tetratricopeptide (TPR) repeat protein
MSHPCFLASFACTLLVLTLAAPAGAQTVATTEAPPLAAPIVDETALRYFARQGDERRLQAEIARLSAIYPGWTPPADPLAVDTGADPQLQAIWDLYGAGDIAGAQAAIAKKTEEQPDWRPPEDLVAALATSGASSELRAAAQGQQHERVLALAATHPELLTCDNMDLLWALGEAFIDTGREQRGVDAYAYILQNCEDPAERVATVQKASLLLDGDALGELFAFERTAPTGEAEFAPIRVDMARREVADLLNGVNRRIDPAAVALLQATVEASPTAEDLRLLGYYELSEHRPRRARDWFEQAVELEDSPESVAGLANALLQLNDAEEAEALLADYRFDSEELEEQYLNAAAELLSGDPPRKVDEEVLDRIIESVTDARHAGVAENLGWYAFNFNQAQTAARWFEEALEYDPASEAAAYGLLVANQKLRNREKVREIMREWGPVSPRIKLFGTAGAPTTAPTAFRLDTPVTLQRALYRFDQPVVFIPVAELTPAQKRAAQLCADFVPPESLSASAALTRAWCLMDLGRSTDAEAAFRRATQSGSVTVRTDAYYGQTLALLRLGLIEDAAVTAAAMPQTPERISEMQIAILSSTAVTYFQIGRYEEVLQILDQRSMLAPEQNDLLTIRAWSYYHLGRLREARQIFAAVAATGYQDAQRGLDAIAGQY